MSGSRRGRTRMAPRPRRKSRHLEGVTEIPEKDYNFLEKFLTEHGKILPGRLTGASSRQQRQVKRAVRRARNIGLLP